MDHTRCYPYHDYGVFDSVKEAEIACSHDNWCIGIYDEKCNELPSHVYLCYDKQYFIHHGACSYNKTGTCLNPPFGAESIKR